MADLKMWDDLSESEQRQFAARVAGAKTQGWEDLAQLAEEAGIEPDEDTLPTIYELTDLFVRTQDPLFPRPVGDQLFAYAEESGERQECPKCEEMTSVLYVLAPNKQEADAVMKSGNGSCGNCQCANIQATHGEVVTQREHCNLDAEDFWRGEVDIRDGEMEDSHDFYFRGVTDFEQAKAYAENYARNFYDADEDDERKPNEDGWYEEPMSGRWFKLGRLQQIKTLEELLSCLYIETVPTPIPAA